VPVRLADEIERIIREGNEIARGLEHGRAWLPERESAIDHESGPRHYATASTYARLAAEALSHEDVARAQALAAIVRFTPHSPRPRRQCKIA
jgi:hypothetical protein